MMCLSYAGGYVTESYIHGICCRESVISAKIPLACESEGGRGVSQATRADKRPGEAPPNQRRVQIPFESLCLGLLAAALPSENKQGSLQNQSRT